MTGVQKKYFVQYRNFVYSKLADEARIFLIFLLLKMCVNLIWGHHFVHNISKHDYWTWNNRQYGKDKYNCHMPTSTCKLPHANFHLPTAICQFDLPEFFPTDFFSGQIIFSARIFFARIFFDRIFFLLNFFVTRKTQNLAQRAPLMQPKAEKKTLVGQQLF